jgi:hypothetical protein
MSSTNDGKGKEQEAPDQYDCPHLTNVRRANQHATWTTCTDCELRTSYQNYSNAKKDWTILVFEVPSSWGSLCPDNAAAESQANQDIVGFGKYRGLPYLRVLQRDLDYCQWVMKMGGRETAKTAKPLKHFAQWLQERMNKARHHRAQHVYEEAESEPVDTGKGKDKSGKDKGKGKGKPSPTKPEASSAEILQQLEELMRKFNEKTEKEKQDTENAANAEFIEIFSDSENDRGDTSDAEWKRAERVPATTGGATSSFQQKDVKMQPSA